MYMQPGLPVDINVSIIAPRLEPGLPAVAPTRQERGHSLQITASSREVPVALE
jgi:hypothetical protein